ncbi:MAG: glycosyltransferase [Verrucomicrobia bacterium]|nr:glycosyltransferase [Verrucomicrobiota bacterium]
MIRPVPDLLLLLPAYNEELRIEPVLRDYARYFRAEYAGKFQMVVVLNGCVDRTLEVVQSVAAEYPEIRVLDFAEPIGKGGALIEGLKLAPTTDLIGYVDADGATKPKAFHELSLHCERYDCVIGSRWLPGSILHQSQSTQRRIVSRGFHAFVQFLFQMGIKDTQCGAKVMRRVAVETIHSSLRIADVAFDINLLYSLKRNGFSILEHPTEWTDQLGSKIKFNKGSIGIVLSVIRLRLFYSPFYRWLRLFRPLEAWIYRKLSAPQPRPGPSESEK